MREQTLKEIIETERAYVHDLSVIVNHIMAPIRFRKLVPAKWLPQLFSNVEVLGNVNRALLDHMEECFAARPLPEVAFGEMFLRMSAMLKVYTEYVSNQDRQTSVYERLLSKHSSFTKFNEVGGEGVATLMV
jgi:RhoGEF domain